MPTRSQIFTASVVCAFIAAYWLMIVAAIVMSPGCAAPPPGTEILPIQEWQSTWIIFDALSVQLANAKLRGDIGDADYARIVKGSVAFRQAMADWRAAMNDQGRYIDGRGPTLADAALAALRAVGAIWTPPPPERRPTANSAPAWTMVSHA